MSADRPNSESSGRLEQLAQMLDQLACPVCLSGLRLEATALVCSACARQYPIVDGIPTLIAPISPED